MKLSPGKMGLYLARTYLSSFLFLAVILLGIVYLFDTIELLRRGSKLSLSLWLILQMGLFKLPEVGQLILPFVVLFSALYSFWHLTRRYELIAMRAAGLSIWQILTPFILTAFFIGVLQVTVINPFGALLISKFESLENTHLKQKSSLISFSGQGLWLKQDHNDGHVILHANKISMPDWVLEDVMTLFFSADKNFIRRLDAQSAVLEEGQWNFRNTVSNEPQSFPEQNEFITLATNLTLQEIEDSFASPETISFWALPAYIKTMKNTGFDPIRMKLHFQNLLSQPLLYISMILLAAAVSMRPPRDNSTFIMIVSGVFIGFFIFFSSSFLQALGASYQIPIWLSAWTAPLVALLLGVSIMMSLEDG